MREIGIRELKARASEILREVRERRATYGVTYRGKVIAQITPADEEGVRTQSEWLAAWDRLVEDIAKTNPGPVDAVELVREGRRG